MANPDEHVVFEHIGRVTARWNEIEFRWYIIFVGLMRETARPKVDAIYNYLQTNAAQRQLTLRLADVALPQAERRELGRLNSRTNDLAGDRNAVIHSIYGAGEHGRTQTFVLVNRQKGNRFAEKDLTHEYLRIANDCRSLRGDLTSFLRQLTSDS